MKKGDLLVARTAEAKTTWGNGVCTEPLILTGPNAHLVFWLSHRRELAIEEEIVESNFDVFDADEAPQELGGEA